MMHKKILGIVCLLLMQTFLRAQSGENDTLILGGAFRYTYMNNSWDKTHDNIGGRAIFDVLILSAKGQVKGVEFSVENRYYAPSFGGFMLRNGYVGLPLTEDLKLKVGMPRNPFGIVPFTSNSFMFNMQYYLGFEDDADVGGVLEYHKDNFAVQLGFAKNSEDIWSQGNNRYAYDVTGNNQEINQFSGRTTYTFGESRNTEVGLSAQYGGLYNLNSQETGNRWAGAVHTVINHGGLGIKAELMAYAFNAKDTIDLNYVEAGAFAANYKIAGEGVSYSIAISYKVDVNHLLLNDIKFYNDFSALEKPTAGYDASYMNVTGCMIHTGPIYMLIDYVVAKNHPWIGTNYVDALAAGGDTQWNRRFNLNLGIYF